MKKHDWRMGENSSLQYEYFDWGEFWACYYLPTGQSGVAKTMQGARRALYRIILNHGLKSWHHWQGEKTDSAYLSENNP